MEKMILIFLNPRYTGGRGKSAPMIFLLLIAKRILSVSHDETLSKFSFHICKDSCNSIWFKKLSRGHVVNVNKAWSEDGKGA